MKTLPVVLLQAEVSFIHTTLMLTSAPLYACLSGQCIIPSELTVERSPQLILTSMLGLVTSSSLSIIICLRDPIQVSTYFFFWKARLVGHVLRVQLPFPIASPLCPPIYFSPFPLIPSSLLPSLFFLAFPLRAPSILKL